MKFSNQALTAVAVALASASAAVCGCIGTKRSVLKEEIKETRIQKGIATVKRGKERKKGNGKGRNRDEEMLRRKGGNEG